MDIIAFWQVAGVLLGFQITAFTIRLNRELQFTDRRQRWFPLADCLNLLSMLISIIFVFLVPITCDDNRVEKYSKIGFGVSIIMFAYYPFAIVAHYELFTKNKSLEQKYAPRSEILIVVLAILTSLVYTLF